MVGNTLHQLDSEHGGDIVTHVTVVNNVMQASPNNSAMTATDIPGNPGGGWAITRNTITGGILIVSTHFINITDNTITASDVPPVIIKNAASDIMVFNNTINETGTGSFLSGVFLEGTDPADMPSRVSVVQNRISVAAPDGYGVRANGALDMTVAGNTITGTTATGKVSHGVGFRVTIGPQPALRCIVTDNTISGVSVGVGLGGNPAATPNPRLGELDVVRNSISAAHGVQLDSENGVPDSLYVHGNNWNGLPVAQRVETIPANTTIIASDASTP